MQVCVTWGSIVPFTCWSSYCLNPQLNGGCVGNAQVPAAEVLSQIFFTAGDSFFNPADSATCSPSSASAFQSVLQGIKISYIVPTNCQGERCRSAEIQGASVAVDVHSKVGCLSLQSGYYVVSFTPPRSGFYSLLISGSNTIGPQLNSINAGPVDSNNTFAYGDGLFGAVENEQVTFSIVPTDLYGNQHTSGMFVFQIFLTPVSYVGLQQSIEPSSYGNGAVEVAYSVSTPGTYSLEVHYCKDLIHYPPYNANENQLCDLSTVSNAGPQIVGSPYTITVVGIQFSVSGGNQPGMMSAFRTAQVGVQYFALLQSNFQNGLCGQTYGTPEVQQRYKPIIRFDIASLQYKSYPPASPVLQAADVSPGDLSNGLFDETRYAQVTGQCLNGAFVFSFVLTISGSYNVWIYVDTVNPQLTAGSPLSMVVAPDPQILSNFRAEGPIISCTNTTLCMANQNMIFYLLAKDKYLNDATECTETVKVQVQPAQLSLDHFTLTNVITNATTGVTTQTNQVHYQSETIQGFQGVVQGCNQGKYEVTIFATLSADYVANVYVGNLLVYGSPFKFHIYPQQIDLNLGSAKQGLVTYTRWSYFRVYIPNPYGFQVNVIKTDSNNGQPWTFLRYDQVFSVFEEPDSRDSYPVAAAEYYCQSCRLHLAPEKCKVGYWYVSVYGFQDDSYFSITVTQYSSTQIVSSVPALGRVEPGFYQYYYFNVTSSAGFQVRASSTTSTQGSLVATLKQDSYPLTEYDASSSLGQALISQRCLDCILDVLPSTSDTGMWFMSVIATSYAVDFQVLFLEFEQHRINFGSKQYSYSLAAYTWGYFYFDITPDMTPDGFRVSVIPVSARYNLTTVLKKATFPISLTDNTFRELPCSSCRVTVMSKLALQSRWYIGVYAGSTGGSFDIRVQLLQSCPNQCFGNGQCVQQKTKNCVCYPGYTGIDCSKVVKEKVFAWYPLINSVVDYTDNKTPMFFVINNSSNLDFDSNGILISDSFLAIPKPTPAVACAMFLNLDQPSTSDLQWGEQVVVNEGTAAQNRVQQTIPEVGDWYRWNQIGNPVGNPFTNETCAEYNPRRELTVMFRFQMDNIFPSRGSLMSLGRQSSIIGRQDVNDNKMWSWQLAPYQHPNGINVLVDLYLRNATHEISVREHAIYPIDGKDIFYKSNRLTSTFPNGWCIDGLYPNPKTGTCKYFELGKNYHLAFTFGPRRVNLYVDATLVAFMDLGLWNLTDVPSGRIEFGHDPRYASFERLFFGRVRGKLQGEQEA
eukprot:748699-Hanusia_phi.AAC.3